MVLRGDELRELTKRPRRYGEIVRAAREVFLAEGFSGASVDRIAEAASVSKQSVYGAFGDKRGLFVAVVAATVDVAGDAVAERATTSPTSGSVASDLRELARGQLQVVMTPEMMRLRRTVIGEAERFPELAAMFYEHGPGRTIEALTDLFARSSSEGTLVIGDPAAAARHFNWLVMAEPVNRAMFLGLPQPPTSAQVDQWATDGVNAFLAIYPLPHPDRVSLSTEGRTSPAWEASP